jgi:predicted Zn-dependent peptidase
VHSYTIQFSTGIGVISASTSKPKETLAAIQKVVEKLKTTRLSKSELDNHKRIYTTTYYLTQEEHSTLAEALSQSEMWFGSTDPLYEMPLELEKVTPTDIQNLAKKLLVNFRIGVVYGKQKFDNKWAQELVTYSHKAPPKKAKKKKG